jgi:hypothetical protein
MDASMDSHHFYGDICTHLAEELHNCMQEYMAAVSSQAFSHEHTRSLSSSGAAGGCIIIVCMS